MKNSGTLFLIFVSYISFFVTASAQIDPPKAWTRGHNWDADRQFGERPDTLNAKVLPLIKVVGNRFVNSNGDTILFHGIAVADPDNLEQRGVWNKDLFIEAKRLGADLVRLPVHPAAWRDRTPEKYLKLLDQAVEWCTEESLYVDIDWHSIGNLEKGLYQNSVYVTSLQETFDFWATIAGRYSGHHTVAFSELFNEPTNQLGKLGSVSWDQWKEINEELIKLIRAYNNQSIPLVAGFDWAYDLSPIRYASIDAEGIAYSVHPYPHKRTPPYEPKWNEDFGFVAAKYPLVATELGFTLPDWQANLEFGNSVIKYFSKNHISWIWWILDPLWQPAMLQSWEEFKLNEGGKFFEAAAHGLVTGADSSEKSNGR
ncbi:MAG TPA: cellulase family glycosylhydrolase [Candidatus Acidoferrales bacterium]|nr:cellulase family glycosylhydrolase [Candidatus Acidoferrales bacterium]